MQAQLEAVAKREAELQQSLAFARQEAAEERKASEERDARARAALQRMAQSSARCESELTRHRVLANGWRLGQVGVQRTGAMGVQEVRRRAALGASGSDMNLNLLLFSIAGGKADHHGGAGGEATGCIGGVRS